MPNRSTVTIHMVCSLDGYIAKPSGDVTWMETDDQFEAGKELTETEISEFLEKIDCYVMGSKTYEHALKLGWPYADKPVFVLTDRELESDKPTVHFHNSSAKELVDQLRVEHTHIWMAGGAELTRSFLQDGLADEIVITFLPILLGEGIPFFKELGKEIPLHLKDVSAYKNGMVDMTYEIR